MLTETTLARLTDLITTTANPHERAELLGALADLQRTIAAQALAVRNLTADLRNRRIGDEALGRILPAGTLDAMLANLGQPRTNPFSLDEARAACDALADQSARASDIGAIAAAIVKVARAFL